MVWLRPANVLAIAASTTPNASNHARRERSSNCPPPSNPSPISKSGSTVAPAAVWPTKTAPNRRGQAGPRSQASSQTEPDKRSTAKGTCGNQMLALKRQPARRKAFQLSPALAKRRPRISPRATACACVPFIHPIRLSSRHLGFSSITLSLQSLDRPPSPTNIHIMEHFAQRIVARR